MSYAISRALRAALGGVVLMSLSACDGPPTGDSCRGDEDCAGYEACVAGHCTPIVSDTPDLAGPTTSPGPTADLGGTTTTDAASSSLCNFNGDGIIEASEVPVVLGVGGLYAKNQDGTPTPVK